MAFLKATARGFSWPSVLKYGLIAGVFISVFHLTLVKSGVFYSVFLAPFIFLFLMAGTLLISTLIQAIRLRNKRSNGHFLEGVVHTLATTVLAISIFTGYNYLLETSIEPHFTAQTLEFQVAHSQASLKELREISRREGRDETTRENIKAFKRDIKERKRLAKVYRKNPPLYSEMMRMNLFVALVLGLIFGVLSGVIMRS